jgi:hypothetical protein
MRFYSGKTTCQVCGRPLDLTDDWIAIPPWDATAEVVTGFYHRTCFDRLPWRNQAALRWRRYNEAQIQSRAASTQVVGKTNRYLLLYGTADRAFELFYWDHLARQRFRAPDEWIEFVQFIRGVAASETFRDNQEGEFESPSRQFSVQIVPPNRVALSWGVPVRREMDFPRAEYDAYAAQHGPLTGFVEFPELVEAGLLHPTMVDGELAKNRGVVVDVKPVKDVYVVVFDAPRIVRLELSREEFTELARFLAGLKLGF